MSLVFWPLAMPSAPELRLSPLEYLARERAAGLDGRGEWRFIART